MLIDSNIIIYSARPEQADLRRFITENRPAVSAISLVEVLGYHRLSEADRADFEAFFATATILPITEPVLEQAVRQRQRRRMALGDALIAATCLVHNRTLVTRNVDDFAWIEGLALLNPFDEVPETPDGQAP